MFHIYEVEGDKFSEVEVRSAIEQKEGTFEQSQPELKQGSENKDNCGSSKSCGNGSDCRSGKGGGCAGNGDVSWKVELVSDCRCVVCKKIGFHIQKQLERRAITSFDVSCSVEEALTKISTYFNKVDSHQSLRKNQVSDRE